MDRGLPGNARRAKSKLEKEGYEKYKPCKVVPFPARRLPHFLTDKTPLYYGTVVCSMVNGPL